ncbi:hypothetical protein PMAYCL1PPCAC_08461, partial [Pristionchus mayeri]
MSGRLPSYDCSCRSLFFYFVLEIFVLVMLMIANCKLSLTFLRLSMFIQFCNIILNIAHAVLFWSGAVDSEGYPVWPFVTALIPSFISFYPLLCCYNLMVFKKQLVKII